MINDIFLETVTLNLLKVRQISREIVIAQKFKFNFIKFLAPIASSKLVVITRIE